MYLIFVDECGYVKQWDKDTEITQQPFYILAAVAIPVMHVHSIYNDLREGIRTLSLPHIDADKLGRGEEIKASSVDRGEDFWGKNQDLRDRVRKLYLDQKYTTYFLACVDKVRYKAKYFPPEDPSRLASQFLFERLQLFLQKRNAHGFVLVNKNKREEAAQQKYTAQLLTEGSGGIAFSEFYGTFYEWRLEFTQILEVHFGDSKYSLGLQIADFVARHAYSWRKADKRGDYPGWSLIEPKLDGYPNYKGWGYKEFPDER